jgi:hypothetical protein
MGVQANTPCPNYNGTGSFAWLPSGNTADAVNNYSTTLQLGSTGTGGSQFSGGMVISGETFQ